MSNNLSYIITDYQILSQQYDKAAGINQVPFFLGLRGVPTIRIPPEISVCSNNLDFSKSCDSQYVPLI